jgi:hypothetical protein
MTNTKTLVQLDSEGFFVGLAVARESPREPGIYLMPALTVDAAIPEIPKGQRARWDGEVFVLEDILPAPEAPPELEPEPPEEGGIPSSVTMRQARLALLAAGLLDTIETTIDALPGVEGEAARIEWEYATTIERANPLFAALTAQLGIPNEQLDQLFITAAAL